MEASFNSQSAMFYGKLRPLEDQCSQCKTATSPTPGLGVEGESDSGAPPKTTALMAACAFGLKEVAENLLAGGAQLDAVNADGCNALDFALFAQQEELVEFLETRGLPPSAPKESLAKCYNAIRCIDDATKVELLQAGAPVDLRIGEDGVTPLIEVADDEDSVEMVKQLLSLGADPNLQRYDSGDTALHRAAKHMILPTVRLLVAHGADLNIQNKKGKTPALMALHYANEEAEEVCAFLLENGADKTIVDRKGDSLLHHAVKRGSLDLMKKAVCPETLNLANAKGATPLHKAFASSTAINDGASPREMADFLIAQGANVKATNGKGRTQLHLAAGLCHFDALEGLLEYCPDIDVKDGSGATPLKDAVRNGWPAGIDLLLSKGADAKAANHQGRTPLFFASERGLLRWTDPRGLEVIAALVNSGAKLDHQDDAGDTALNYALGMNSPRWHLAEGLVLSGSDPLIRNHAGEHPFETMWRLLEANPSEAPRALLRAMALSLLNRGVHANVKAEDFSSCGKNTETGDAITMRLIADTVQDPEALPSWWRAAAAKVSDEELNQCKASMGASLETGSPLVGEGCAIM